MSSLFVEIINKIRNFSLRNDTMTTGSLTVPKVLSKMNFLLITANVGTLFEDPEGIQKVWLDELFKVVKHQKPKFIAIHCQEIGGKDYKSSMEPVKDFFHLGCTKCVIFEIALTLAKQMSTSTPDRLQQNSLPILVLSKLSNADELKEFVVTRGYLDGDFDDVHQYTALGNMYFVHQSVSDVKLFSYEVDEFQEVKGKDIFSKNITCLPSVRKEKFEQDFFPDCKWSRKGYCRVRWKIYGKVVEFVNIHLFHDDSNLIAIKSTPSPYTAYRKRALRFVLKRLQDQHPCEGGVSFVFGDFNFRLDVKSLVQKLCPDSKQQVVRSNDEVTRLLYRSPEKVDDVEDLKSSEDNHKVDKSAVSNGEDDTSANNNNSDDVIVKIEKKLFKVEKSLLLPDSSHEQLRLFDMEPSDINSELKEFDISFPPTYPFSEDVSESTAYMTTRCPSWCDRILLTQQSWEWIHSQKDSGNATYDTIGKSVCMGDHKPVYLAFSTDITSPMSEQQTPSNPATTGTAAN